jgi:hypothetical protein
VRSAGRARASKGSSSSASIDGSGSEGALRAAPEPSAGAAGGLREHQQQLQQAIGFLWCAAVLDAAAPAPLLGRLASVLQHLQPEQLSTASLAQLAQVHMWCQAKGPGGQQLAAQLPARLVATATELWRQQVVPAVSHSDMQAALLGQLKAMQLQPQLEARTPDGMFSVDIILSYKAVPVALEVMGPEHFSANQVVLPAEAGAAAQAQAPLPAGTKGGAAASAPAAAQPPQPPQPPQHVLSGPDLLRLRLLAARGFALAVVSSFELGTLLSRRPAAVQQLLADKLEEAVVLHSQQQQGLPQQQPSRDSLAPAAASSSRTRRRQQQQRADDDAAGGRRASTQQQQQLLVSRFRQQPDVRTSQERRWQKHMARKPAHARGVDMQRQALQSVLSVVRSSGSDSSNSAAVPELPAPAAARPQLVIEREFDLSVDLDELAVTDAGDAGTTRAPVE